MPTLTSNYSFNKPNVNSADDEDLWGDQLNDNWDSVDALLRQIMPAGAMLDFGGTSAPAGFLLCDGSEVSRTTYSSLFSAIGTTWGSGDGSTTFNIPDLRGRVSAGQDNMGGTAANRLTSAISGVDGTTVGASGGDENLQEHNHGVTDPGHSHNVDYMIAVQSGNSGGQGWFNDGGTSKATTSTPTGITIDNEGTGASENVQPTAVVLKIIKT